MNQSDSLLALIASLHAELLRLQNEVAVLNKRLSEAEKPKE